MGSIPVGATFKSRVFSRKSKDFLLFKRAHSFRYSHISFAAQPIYRQICGMAELDEYESGILDAMLEAFGVPDSLTRAQVLTLFDDDEAIAFSMVQVLLREELITISGQQGDFELPDKLILKPKGDKFLKAGGFTRRRQLEREKPAEIGGTLSKLQQQNFKLQHLRRSAEAERDELVKSVNRLRLGRYAWWTLILVAFIVGFLLGRHK